MFKTDLKNLKSFPNFRTVSLVLLIQNNYIFDIFAFTELESVSSDFQTHQSWFKKLGCALFFNPFLSVWKSDETLPHV